MELSNKCIKFAIAFKEHLIDEENFLILLKNTLEEFPNIICSIEGTEPLCLCSTIDEKDQFHYTLLQNIMKFKKEGVI